MKEKISVMRDTDGSAGNAHARIFTRYMNEVMDECEKLPADKSLPLREKLDVLRSYAEDGWVQRRGGEALFPYLDYKILWFFLKRGMCRTVYALCVMRRAVVGIVHGIRRKK